MSGGLRGRPKKPEAWLRLMGCEKSLKNREKSPAPKPPESKLDAPAELVEPARGPWDEVVEAIRELGVESKTDRFAVELLAFAVSQHRRLAAWYVETGGVQEYVSEKGSTIRQPAPEFAMMTAFNKQIMSLIDRLGLSPAARERLTAKHDDSQEIDFARARA